MSPTRPGTSNQNLICSNNILTHSTIVTRLEKTCLEENTKLKSNRKPSLVTGINEQQQFISYFISSAYYVTWLPPPYSGFCFKRGPCKHVKQNIVFSIRKIRLFIKIIDHLVKMRVVSRFSEIQRLVSSHKRLDREYHFIGTSLIYIRKFPCFTK